MTTAIQAEGLVKRFGDTRALDGVDLAVPAATVLGLLGPNGSGKTTTVRILTTLLIPDAGRASVAGYDIARRPMAVRATIGLTGQYAAVDENLTGREHLELIGNLLELPRQVRRARAAALLDRVTLAESRVGNPRVLFLDEPTTGLDPGQALLMSKKAVRELTDGKRRLYTALAESVPRGEQRMLDDAAHSTVHIDRPDAVPQAIHDLLGRVDS